MHEQADISIHSTSAKINEKHYWMQTQLNYTAKYAILKK